MSSDFLDPLLMREWQNQSLPRSRDRQPTGHWTRLAGDAALDDGHVKADGSPAFALGVLSLRTYGAAGGLYPRLVLSILDWTAQGGGVKVGVYRKDGPSEYWRDCGCPRELCGELAEMLAGLGS